MRHEGARQNAILSFLLPDRHIHKGTLFRCDHVSEHSDFSQE